ncbi:vWA domain-containing protein [Flexivirga sp. B27]
MRHLRTAAAAVGVCALTTSLASIAAPSAHATSPDVNGKLEIVLDASGSMADPDADGTPKIDTARSSLTTMVNSLDPHLQVGMRVYGATAPPGKDTKQACSDSRQVVPVKKLDRPALRSAIKRYEPKGQTPTAYALQKAAKDLGTTGQRSIVLVSDGESTCSPDPCDTAKALAAKGIDLRVDVIGFKVDKKARSQLSCISSVTNGKYFDADDSKALTSALQTVKTRASQPFSISGKAVEGAPTSSDAPTIEAGRWTDSVPADGQTAKYYKLHHTMAGSSFMVGVTSRPKAADSQLDLSVTTADGTRCGSDSPQVFGFAKASRDLLTGVLSTAPRFDSDKACNSQDLFLKVEQSDWGDDVAGTPMQIDVVETPAPTNPSILKRDTKRDASWQDMPAQTSSGTAVGGSGLATATRLKPGTKTIELMPGEFKFFKVSAGWGQQVQTMATAEQNPAYDASTSFRRLSTDILSPAGGVANDISPDNMPEGESGKLDHSELIDDEGGRVGAVTNPIRLANRTAYTDSKVAGSVAGDYYVVVGLSTRADGKDTVRTPLKVSLQVATPGSADADTPRFAKGEHIKGAGTTPTGTAANGTAQIGQSKSDEKSDKKTDESKAPKKSSASSEGDSGSTHQAAGAAQTVAADKGGMTGTTDTNWKLIGGLTGGAGLLAVVGAGAALALRRRG